MITIKQALDDVHEKLKDPAYMAEVLARMDYMCLLEEIEYDRTGIVPWSIGDDITYAGDHGYPEYKHELLRQGSYARHGNGD